MLRYPVSGPCNRASTADNRAVRPLAVLLAICCCLSAVSAQRLEKVIYLPDSLSGLAGPTCIALNRSNGTLYVAGEGTNVIAISESTGKKVARLDVGSRVNAICCDSTANKVYVALWADTVVVIDGADNTIRARLPAGDEPAALLYDSLVNKVFCANSRSGNVTVIDALLDSVVATIPAGDDPAAFCYDPTGTKVYCALSGDGEVAVLDAQADTLLLTIDVGREPCALLCNSQRNEIYCANRGDRSISVISVPDDSAISTVTTARYPRALAYDSTRDRLYVACENREVTVIDCVADTVCAHIAVDYKPWDVLYNGTSDRVYCANYSDQLVVIDAAADTIVKTLTVAARPCALALNADRNDVYCVSAIGNAHTVIDASQDTVAATELTGCSPDFACFSDVTNKLYVGYGLGPAGQLSVIDGTTSEVLRSVPLEHYSWVACHNPVSDKVYVLRVADSVLTAIDCVTDTVVAEIAVPGGYAGEVCYNPNHNKVYCTNYGGRALAVVDAEADSVVATIMFPDNSFVLAMCFDTTGNRLFVGTDSSFTSTLHVVDGATDNIVGSCGTSTSALSMCYDQANQTLYGIDGMNGYCCVVDCKENTPQEVGVIPFSAQLSGACWNSEYHKVYVSSWWTGWVWVIDTKLRQITDSIYLREWAMLEDVFYNPLSNRVYCGGDYVFVVDGQNDSVLTVFPAVSSSRSMFALNRGRGRVYALNSYGSSVLVIADTLLVSLQDGTATPNGRTCLPPTVVRGLLFLAEAASHKPQAASLLDISGRRVLDLHPGANDVRALAPGVYFIKEQSVVSRQQTGTASVTKVVLAR